MDLDLTPEHRALLGFNRRTFDSIPDDWWVALLGMYRTLRIRIPYAEPGSPDLGGYRHSGQSYGMSRDEARKFLWNFAAEIDWHIYLGSK